MFCFFVLFCSVCFALSLSLSPVVFVCLFVVNCCVPSAGFFCVVFFFSHAALVLYSFAFAVYACGGIGLRDGGLCLVLMTEQAKQGMKEKKKKKKEKKKKSQQVLKIHQNNPSSNNHDRAVMYGVHVGMESKHEWQERCTTTEGRKGEEVEEGRKKKLRKEKKGTETASWLRG